MLPPSARAPGSLDLLACGLVSDMLTPAPALRLPAAAVAQHLLFCPADQMVAQILVRILFLFL